MTTRRTSNASMYPEADAVAVLVVDQKTVREFTHKSGWHREIRHLSCASRQHIHQRVAGEKLSPHNNFSALLRAEQNPQ